MRVMFQQEMKDVQSRIIEIADDILTIVGEASNALTEADVKAADRALAGAELVSEKALSLDELVIRVIARQAPVARDLASLCPPSGFPLHWSAWLHSPVTSRPLHVFAIHNRQSPNPSQILSTNSRDSLRD